MPAAVEYVEDSNRDQAMRHKVSTETRERRKVYDLNKKYYDGNHEKPLYVGDDKVDDNVLINLARQAVDRTVDFLVPEFPQLELDVTEETDAEARLRELWRENGGAILLKRMVRDGALAGHGFARVYPSEPSPGILLLPPTNVTVFWNEDNASEVLWYEINFKVGKTEIRQDIVAENGSNGRRRWRIREFIKNRNKWELTDEQVWPYSLPPVVDWQHMPSDTGRYYGDHELRHLALNDAYNRIASDIARILRFHAYPRTIGTGFEAENVQATGIDDFWTIPSPDAKVFNLEMQSDLAASVRFLDVLERHFMRQSRVVIMSGSPEEMKNITNLGIQALFMDMLTKNETLRRQYTRVIQQISLLLMALDGTLLNAPPGVEWGNPLPVDTGQQINELQRMAQLGLISKKTAAAKVGLNYEQEVAQMKDEAEQEGLQLESLLTGPRAGVS